MAPSPPVNVSVYRIVAPGVVVESITVCAAPKKPPAMFAVGAAARMLPGGRLLLEIGPTQGAAVSALLRKQGLAGIRILPDLDGRDRVVCAEKTPADSDSDAT